MNGQTFLLAALAVLPCCILLAFFVRNDQVEASSRGFRIIAPSILGALTAPLALAVQTAIRPYWDVDPVTITVSSAVYCFAVIALSEEGLKFTVAWIFRRRFKEPYDGIVFAVAAAMGFALVENVRYVFAAGLETGLMRSVLAVPAHALFGVCIGYFLGRARFCRKFSQRVWNTVAAFGWAWAMHGAYDCTLIYAGKGPSLLLFPLVGIFWLAALWEMDLHISQSPFRYYPRGDRRVWARYQLDSPARVFPLDQAGEGIPVFIHDIGLGGVQLICAVDLPKTADLLIAEHPLRLRLEFEVLAEQNHEHQTMYRCRFATMNWRTRKRFELFLHEVLSRAEGDHSDPSAPPQQ